MTNFKITNLFESDESMEENIDFAHELDTIESSIDSKKIEYANNINKIISESVENDGSLTGAFVEFFNDKQFTPEDVKTLNDFLMIVKDGVDQWGDETKLPISVYYLDIEHNDNDLDKNSIINYFFNSKGETVNDLYGTIIPHINYIKEQCDYFNSVINTIENLADLSYQKNEVISAFNIYVPIKLLLFSLVDLIAEHNKIVTETVHMNDRALKQAGKMKDVLGKKEEKVNSVIEKAGGAENLSDRQIKKIDKINDKFDQKADKLAAKAKEEQKQGK